MENTKSEPFPGSLHEILVANGAALPTASELFRRHSTYVAAIALRLLGRDAELDDVVQDVFVRAIRGISAIREPEAVRQWLTTVTVRVARRRLRIRKVRSLLGLDDAHDYETLVGPGATPEQSALLSRIYAALDRLPVELRIAWTLRHIEGQSLGDVASACGCSLATAKRRVSTAHKILRKAVS